MYNNTLSNRLHLYRPLERSTNLSLKVCTPSNVAYIYLSIMSESGLIKRINLLPLLGLKSVAKRIKKLNPFERNDVDRQGPLIFTPFLLALLGGTAVATYGIAQQTGINEELMHLANETMHYFDGIYLHSFLLY